jgi:hypothetical protein
MARLINVAMKHKCVWNKNKILKMIKNMLKLERKERKQLEIKLQ